MVNVDAELVARVRAGDMAAWDALVERHADACWRFAYRLLGHRADAEDAVQESWLRVCCALPRYTERALFKSWLFQILVNECRSARERRARDRLRLVDDVGATHRVAARPEQSDLQDALQRGLASLDPLQREAVLLKLGEGLEYEEMARMTGSSVSALKMRVMRGRELLRQFFDRHDLRENGTDDR